MKRRIVQQGAATLMVSLPTAWAKKHELQKGMEVDIEEKGDNLLVNPMKETAKPRLELDVTGLDKSMLRFLVAIYKAGYDELKLKFDTPETIHTIQESIGKEISGYEIIDQGRDYCVLQDIEGVIKERFDVALKRTFILLLQMSDESLDCVREKRFTDLKPLRFLEETNNRFTTFCRRLLSKKGYSNPDKTQFVYLVVDRLEKVADEYKFMFDHLMKSNKPVSPQAIQQYEKLNQFLKLYYDFFYNYDKKKIIRLTEMRKDIVEGSLKLFAKSSNHDCMVLHYLLVICQTMFDSVEVVVSIRY